VIEFNYKQEFKSAIETEREDYHYDTGLLTILRAIAFGTAWIASELEKMNQEKSYYQNYDSHLRGGRGGI